MSNLITITAAEPLQEALIFTDEDGLRVGCRTIREWAATEDPRFVKACALSWARNAEALAVEFEACPETIRILAREVA